MPTIADQLGILKQLQAVDSQIYGLRAERREQPLAIEALRQQLADARQHLTEAEEQLKALQTQHKAQELDLASREAQGKKLQTQLFQVKTNKEYTAMQHEIEGLKADTSTLEETIIRLLEQVDTAQGQMRQAKAAWQQRETQTAQETKRIEGTMAALDQQIEALEADRQRLTPSLDRSVLAQYERVLVNRDGLALVPLAGEVCGGCHMMLPPQVANEVAQQMRLTACDNCARLLYYEES